MTIMMIYNRNHRQSGLFRKPKEDGTRLTSKTRDKNLYGAGILATQEDSAALLSRASTLSKKSKKHKDYKATASEKVNEEAAFAETPSDQIRSVNNKASPPAERSFWDSMFFTEKAKEPEHEDKIQKKQKEDKDLSTPRTTSDRTDKSKVSKAKGTDADKNSEPMTRRTSERTDKSKVSKGTEKSNNSNLISSMLFTSFGVSSEASIPDESYSDSKDKRKVQDTGKNNEPMSRTTSERTDKSKVSKSKKNREEKVGNAKAATGAGTLKEKKAETQATEALEDVNFAPRSPSSIGFTNFLVSLFVPSAAEDREGSDKTEDLPGRERYIQTDDMATVISDLSVDDQISSFKVGDPINPDPVEMPLSNPAEIKAYQKLAEVIYSNSIKELSFEKRLSVLTTEYLRYEKAKVKASKTIRMPIERKRQQNKKETKTTAVDTRVEQNKKEAKTTTVDSRLDRVKAFRNATVKI